MPIARYNRPADRRRRVLKDLEARVAEFAARPGAGAFAAIGRAEVARGLLERIAEPVAQDQGAATLSGPAAFLFCLLNDAPELYAQYVIDLYEQGAARLGAIEVCPGEACRGASPAPGRIAPVDWIALASLRDSETPIPDYESADDTAVPLTSPEILAGWFAATGYVQVRDETDRFFPKTHREIADLGVLYMQGRRVCLYVSADLLSGSPEKARSLRPNQWVVLTSPTDLADEALAMTIYAWGATCRVPRVGRLALEQFRQTFYGFVAALYPP